MGTFGYPAFRITNATKKGGDPKGRPSLISMVGTMGFEPMTSTVSAFPGLQTGITGDNTRHKINKL